MQKPKSKRICGKNQLLRNKVSTFESEIIDDLKQISIMISSIDLPDKLLVFI